MSNLQKVTSSKSSLTGKEYKIPENINDRELIDGFIKKNIGKKVVVVKGLGFVGAVMSLIVANALNEEYAVIGIDQATPQSYWKIISINEGSFPIISSDTKIDLFYTKSREKGNFIATADSYAYTIADIIIVDINLDVQKQSTPKKELLRYDVNLIPFKKAASTIATYCKEDVLILVETTVPPGTCQHIVKPIFDEKFSERGLQLNYKLGHSYERVMPGPDYIDSIQNFYRVYSGIDEESANATEKFLRTIISTETYPLTRLNSTTATEMAKVMENSYRAMNIAFIQEWTNFAEDANVNLFKVVDAIRMRPTHRNIMMPGLGVGGYCLTKDPLMASWAAQNIFSSKPLTQSEKAVSINDTMPHHSFSVIQKSLGHLDSKKILMLGISYLSNVGDTRYTPTELLYDLLIEQNSKVTVHDPFVPYWEEKQMKVNTSLSDVFNETYDAILLCTAHDIYKNNPSLIQFIQQSHNCWVIDTNKVLSDSEVDILNTMCQLKVIGRGDI